WLAARHRVLDEPWNHVPMLRRLAIGGIALGWLTGLPDALMIAGLLPLPEAVYWMFAGMNYLGGLICGLGYAAAFALLAMRLEGRTAHPGPAPETHPAEPESPAVTSPVGPEPSTLAPAQLAYRAAARTDDPAPCRSPRSAASRAECGRTAVADLLSAAVGAADAADGRLGAGYRRAHLPHRGGGDRLSG